MGPMGPGGFRRRGRRRGLVVGAAVGASMARNNANNQAQNDQMAEDETAQPAQTAAPAPSTDDKFDQLEKLAKLKDEGVLTQAEFDAQKAIILNQ